MKEIRPRKANDVVAAYNKKSLRHVLRECPVLHLRGEGDTVHRAGSDVVDWVDWHPLVNLQSHTNE